MPRLGEGEYLKITDPDKPQETPPTRPKKSLSQLLADYCQSTNVMKAISFILLGLMVLLAIWLFGSIVDLVKLNYPGLVLPGENLIKIIIGAVVGLAFFRSAIDGQPQSMIYWSVILLIILVPLFFWQGIYQARPERDQSIIIHRQRPVQEKVVTFNPGEEVDTGLASLPGDLIKYSHLDGSFKVREFLTDGEQFHEVNYPSVFRAQKSGTVVIFGDTQKGSVKITVIPKR